MAEYAYGSNPTKRKKNGKPCSILMHRRIWMEHHGEIPKGFLVHHKNGNKFDNRIENLELMSHSQHAIEHWARRKKINTSKELFGITNKFC